MFPRLLTWLLVGCALFCVTSAVDYRMVLLLTSNDTAQEQQWIKTAQLSAAQVSDLWNSDRLLVDIVFHHDDELSAVGAAIQAGQDASVVALVPVGDPALVDTVFTAAYWHNVRSLGSFGPLTRPLLISHTSSPVIDPNLTSGALWPKIFADDLFLLLPTAPQLPTFTFTTDYSGLALPQDAVYLKTRSPSTYITTVLGKLLAKYDWTTIGMVVSTRDYELGRT